MQSIVALALASLWLFIIASMRMIYVLPFRERRVQQNRLSSQKASQSKKRLISPSDGHALIILGSGGHTSEMFKLLRTLSPIKISRRTYVFSSGDAHSAKHATVFEESLAKKSGSAKKKEMLDIGPYRLLELPRARRVKQSWLTTPFTCLICLFNCLSVVSGGDISKYPAAEKQRWKKKFFPDVIVTNGPGTAVMVILAVYFFKVLGLCSTRVIYVESFARVQSLSLSGKLILPFAHRFLVQWEPLAEKYKNWDVECHGVLVT